MEWLTDPQTWIALVTLTVLEIVLGIDNIVFIAILAGKLPEDQRQRARTTGLALALITRILLLLSLGWVMSLTAPLFRLGPAPVISPEVAAGAHAAGVHIRDPWGISGRDLILLLGGLFLIWKSTHEIHAKLEGQEGHTSTRVAPSFKAIIGQILILDVVFSLDSVITAVGMASDIGVMIAAVVIAVGVMLVFAGTISSFVERHPTIKMLALSFLVLIGVNLLAEGLDQHIEKGYTYFAMGFAVLVEVLNLRMRSNAKEPVHLRHAVSEDGADDAGAAQ
ncbi:MAG: Integral rane protein TerC [Armatimonadetes bacterium]|jgi:predicted tellurium resistance membrane protein TerC|nr:Integral rane protein TerC [Armatimonadota bacterium]